MTNVIVRMDSKLKNDAKQVLAKQGIDMSTAIKMFFSQIVIEKGIPFLPAHNPKLLTKKQLDLEVANAIRGGKKYSSSEELLRDII